MKQQAPWFPYQSRNQRELDERIRELTWCPWGRSAARRGNVVYIETKRIKSLVRSSAFKQRVESFLFSGVDYSCCVLHEPCLPIQQTEQETRNRAIDIVSQLGQFLELLNDKSSYVGRRERKRITDYLLLDSERMLLLQDEALLVTALSPFHETDCARHQANLVLSCIWTDDVPPNDHPTSVEVVHDACNSHGATYNTAKFWVPGCGSHT